MGGQAVYRSNPAGYEKIAGTTYVCYAYHIKGGCAL